MDLNDLVSLPAQTYLIGASINDAGQIMANGSDHHTYFLTLATVPEPGTWALMLMGLGGMAGLARREEKIRQSGASAG